MQTFPLKNAFKNVVCIRTAILFGPQCFEYAYTFSCVFSRHHFCVFHSRHHHGLWPWLRVSQWFRYCHAHWWCYGIHLPWRKLLPSGFSHRARLSARNLCANLGTGSVEPHYDMTVWIFMGVPLNSPHSSGLNPLHAKFFRGNLNIYLHFVSFLHIDTMQVVEILPQIRQEPTYST